MLALPPYRKRLRTTNRLGQLNQEIRCRERVIRMFPNRDSTVRLIGVVFLEQDELWSTGYRYFRIESNWVWRQGNNASRQRHP